VQELLKKARVRCTIANSKIFAKTFNIFIWGRYLYQWYHYNHNAKHYENVIRAIINCLTPELYWLTGITARMHSQNALLYSVLNNTCTKIPRVCAWTWHWHTWHFVPVQRLNFDLQLRRMRRNPFLYPATLVMLCWLCVYKMGSGYENVA
jgi:hypothetical protein